MPPTKKFQHWESMKFLFKIIGKTILIITKNCDNKENLREAMQS
jgi:hypothetical protein